MIQRPSPPVLEYEIRELRLEDLGHDTYEDYLRSSWWQKRRARILAARRYACERCGGRTRLQVRHLTFLNLGAEQDEDLLVVCEAHAHDELDDEQRAWSPPARPGKVPTRERLTLAFWMTVILGGGFGLILLGSYYLD
jgi:hypothetical protein